MYAIVCSESTNLLWATAVLKLRDKYEKRWPGQVHQLTYPNSCDQRSDSDSTFPVLSCLPRLSELRPCYCCFVAHYSECDKKFIREVNQLTRQLDPSNPYTDTVWGVLTGLTEEDVLFAIDQDPLIIRRVVGNCPIDLEKFYSGIWFSELEQCVSYRKESSKSITLDTSQLQSNTQPSVMKEGCAPDPSLLIASEISTHRCPESNQGVDMIISSAHATERDWNIGYTFRSGKFLCHEGQLYGLSLEGERMDVQQTGYAKILSAAGNCLMGFISDKDCMALAWMHSANVVQMVGYIEPTWYGYGGWGVHNYFINNPGSMTFATAFFANQQSLLYLLHNKYRRHVEASLGEHGEVYRKCFKSDHSAKEGLSRECSGLLYDRDNVVFYGDPAWEATLAENKQLYHYISKLVSVNQPEIMDTSLVLDNSWSYFEYHLCTIKAGCWNTKEGDDKQTSPGRPPLCIFPWKANAVKLIKGEAVLTCRFLMLPLMGNFIAGEEYRVVFAVKN